MPTVLSTKKLRLSQKQLLLNSGIGLVEYDAIQIEPTHFKWTPKPTDHLIFTSKNAVKAVLQKFPNLSEINSNTAFCVGKATRKLLNNAGIKNLESFRYSRELAERITKKYADRSFVYFCGNRRREELPLLLEKHGVKAVEIVVYKTSLKKKTFDRSFDGLLFFSPSGVQSFFAENEINSNIAFCIGETTAAEARKHTKSVLVANKPSIENVIVQAVKYFQK